jgi:hypothetical protein
MTKQHPVSELVERDNEPTTGNAQRIAAEITQALQDAGYSCAVLKATPGGKRTLADDSRMSALCQKRTFVSRYSITSSALARRFGGT